MLEQLAKLVGMLVGYAVLGGLAAAAGAAVMHVSQDPKQPGLVKVGACVLLGFLLFHLRDTLGAISASEP